MKKAEQWTANRLKRCLKGGAVAYVGYLANLAHDELTELVEQHGGRMAPSPHTAGLIVIGGAGLPVTTTGSAIAFDTSDVITERRFTELLCPDCETDRDGYTVEALAEVLGIPAARVTAWAKAGLIRPQTIEHGVMRFDFGAAGVARTLVNLTAAGVRIDTLRKTLQKLRTTLPELDEPLRQLATLERNGPLLFRLETGDLAAVDGQLQMDFDHHGVAGVIDPEPIQLRLVPAERTAHEWHALAVEQEQNGLLTEAEKSYRQALAAGGPNAKIAFDLAHLLAETGRLAEARERYHQVVEIDPDCVDAWNNLGILHADAGDLPAAADAFRAALRLAPDDARAHYNLADALQDLGLAAEAAPHWSHYLRLAGDASPQSDYARRLIGER
jgi:tetratricopeptide (TPR) repeat protein